MIWEEIRSLYTLGDKNLTSETHVRVGNIKFCSDHALFIGCYFKNIPEFLFFNYLIPAGYHPHCNRQVIFPEGIRLFG